MVSYRLMQILAGLRLSSPTNRQAGDVSISTEPAVDSSEPVATEEYAEVTGHTILLLGTLGGGGIHHYIESLDAHLRDALNVRVYDMYSEPTGSGIPWLLRSILRSTVALMRFPLQRRPDIIHAHASQDYSFYRVIPYVLFASIVWRRPVILHIHGSSFDRFLETDSALVRLVQSLAFSHVDHVVVLSAYWESVFNKYGYDGKITAIPNAVDVEAYSPKYDPEVPQVAFVSNLVERKGIVEFIEAVQSLADEVQQPFTVSIAGTGPYRSLAAELADGVDCVEYLGYISEEEKQSLLSRSSIFVLPTYAEGLPFALLEGMAGGNAVVTTPVGSIPEVLDDAGGVFVEPGDTESLRSGLRRLICSPSTVRDMGQYNRELVERRYGWDVVVDTVLSTYHTVLDEEADHLR